MSPKAFRERGYLSLFASYYRPHMALFLLDMICALGIAAVDLSFPRYPAGPCRPCCPTGCSPPFCRHNASSSLAYVLKAGLGFIVTYWGHLMGVRIEADIRRDLLPICRPSPFSFYERTAPAT